MSRTPAEMDGIEQTVRRFVVGNFLFGNESTPLGRTDSLLESGTIDSTGVLELVAFLEQRFNIRVGNDELVPDNFDSIANLTAYVSAKLPD